MHCNYFIIPMFFKCKNVEGWFGEAVGDRVKLIQILTFCFTTPNSHSTVTICTYHEHINFTCTCTHYNEGSFFGVNAAFWQQFYGEYWNVLVLLYEWNWVRVSVCCLLSYFLLFLCHSGAFSFAQPSHYHCNLKQQSRTHRQ